MERGPPARRITRRGTSLRWRSDHTLIRVRDPRWKRRQTQAEARDRFGIIEIAVSKKQWAILLADLERRYREMLNF
jgi:hypothetical protein